MKKFALIITLILTMTSIPTLADDGFNTSGDIWENFGDQNIYGQKPVTDEEFDKVIEKKKVKRNFWGKEIKNKNIPKGEEYRQSNETSFIKEVEKELPIVLIPVALKVGEDSILPVGHYQIVGEKENDGQIYLKFYQAHNLIVKLPATETQEDFNQKTVHFANWLENGEDSIKFIYGSLDFNAYATVPIYKE